MNRKPIIAFLAALLIILLNPFNAAAQYKYRFVIAKDGSGDYKFIQDAIDVMRAFGDQQIVVQIKNGVYNEKIEIPTWVTNVAFIGESAEKTIINFNDYSGRGKMSTFTSYTARIMGNDFYAENITFQNSAGPVGQAVALHVEADRAKFKNCRFLGNQDTIYAAGEGARQYFTNCYIEGTTDFIFGPATVLFENCTIKSKTNSYVTAASTPQGAPFGFVFLDCKLVADSTATKVLLGRPWRNYARTAFIRCDLGRHITPEGWNNWSKPEAEKTTYYAEYKNTGVGAARTSRTAWSHQLTDKEAKLYTVENILAGRATQTAPDWYRK